MKETKAEALRTMIVPGQALSDDDDDEGDDTVLGETRSEESEKGDESEFEPLVRDLVAQEVGIMHQVSYPSSVSTFCRN